MRTLRGLIQECGARLEVATYSFRDPEKADLFSKEVAKLIGYEADNNFPYVTVTIHLWKDE